MSFTGKIRDCIAWMRNEVSKAKAKGKDEPRFEVKVKVKRTRRTDTQNAYYWVLLGKIGQALGFSKDELHFEMLRSYGVYDAFTVREDVPLGDYFKYWDEAGDGWMDGIRYVHVRAYKRSSRMDKAEFGRLLDGVIQECHQQGIETMAPDEIARLEWIGGGDEER